MVGFIPSHIQHLRLKVMLLVTHQYTQNPDLYAHCAAVSLHVSARDECSLTGWSSQGSPPEAALL